MNRELEIYIRIMLALILLNLLIAGIARDVQNGKILENQEQIMKVLNITNE